MTDRRGAPPVPIELKRQIGRTPTTTAGGRPLPDRRDVVSLPAAQSLPEYPTDIGPEGAAVWRSIWAHGVVWISPATDLHAAELAARLADDLAVARRRYQAVGDPKDGRMVVSLSKAFSDALADLGFNPTARARLGVAEVTRVSKLESLRRKTESG